MDMVDILRKLSKQNVLDIAHSILKLSLKCLPIWQLLVTTFTLLSCTCSPWSVQRVNILLWRSMRKWSKMGGAVHRPCFRAGVNEKHEDEWRLNKRNRNDSVTPADMAPFDASLCWDESYNAGSHRSLLQYRRAKQGHFRVQKNRDMKDTQTMLNTWGEHKSLRQLLMSNIPSLLNKT